MNTAKGRDLNFNPFDPPWTVGDPDRRKGDRRTRRNQDLSAGGSTATLDRPVTTDRSETGNLISPNASDTDDDRKITEHD